MTDTLEAETPSNGPPVRERHRPTHFVWHGDRWAFHRLEDGITLARLDPYTAAEQEWRLLSKRIIHVTGAEVRDITRQVHGLNLPDTRPEGYGVSDWDEARIRAMEARLAALEARPDQARPTDGAIHEQNDMLRARNEALQGIADRAEESRAKIADELAAIKSSSVLEGDGMGGMGEKPTDFDEEDEIVATINVRGVDYNITGRDTMLFTAALVRGLNQETSTIKLASGEALELTLADIEDIAAQLVGPLS